MSAADVIDVLTFGPLRRAGEATAPAPSSSSSSSWTTGNDPAAAAAAFQEQARNAVKASMTSAVRQIEAMPHSAERLSRASELKNTLDAQIPWTDSGPTWDTYQRLLGRLRTLRNATMGLTGKSASGATVQIDAAHLAQHGTPWTAAAGGFVEGAGEGLGAGVDRLSGALDKLIALAPWIAAAIGAVVVLQIARGLR